MSQPLSRLLLGLSALIVVAAGLLSFAGSIPGNIDDAFVTLVYARHLALDGALYWNQLDGPIDGFTSLLDMLLKALAFKLGSHDGLRSAWFMALASHLMVGLCALFVVAAHGGHRTTRNALIAAATGIAVAGSQALADGSVFLLEAPLFIALVVIAIAGVTLGQRPSSLRTAIVVLLLALVPLARPEGAPIALAAACLFAWLHGESIPQRRRFAPLVVVFGTLAAYFSFRLLYFGTWAPNTYYAKTSTQRHHEIVDGLAYVVDFASASWLPAALSVGSILVAPCLLPCEVKKLRLDRPALGFSGLALLASIMTIYSGGDCYSGGRFLGLPIVSSLIALGCIAATGSKPRSTVAAILVVSLAVAQSTLQLSAGADRLMAMKRWPLSDEQFGCEKKIIEAIAAAIGTGSLAQSDWQRFKYFSDETHVVDLHGLNTDWIAHLPIPGRIRDGKFHHALVPRVDADAWVYGYGYRHFFPLAAARMDDIFGPPDIARRFVEYETPPAMLPPQAETIRAIKQRYRPASIQGCGWYYNVFVKRDLLAKFAASGFLVPAGVGPDPD